MLFIGGIVTLVSLTAMCWIVGFYMLIAGVIIGVFEAPIIYQYFEATKGLVGKFQRFRPIHRTVLYILCGGLAGPLCRAAAASPHPARARGSMAIFPFFCVGAMSIICGLLLIMTAFCYFMQWLGPRVRVPCVCAWVGG